MGAEEFCLYADEQLSRRTPYSGDNAYVKASAQRLDKTIGLVGSETIAGSRVLDVGASPFYLLHEMKKRGAAECHGLYYTTDDHPLKDAAAVYSKHGPISIYHANVEEDGFPFGDDTFDLVFVCEILEHLDRFPEHLCREVSRVVKPGGSVCLTVPNVCRLENIVKLVSGKNIYMKYRPDTYGRHKHEYTAAELRDLIGYMGLDLVTAGHLDAGTSRNRWKNATYAAFNRVPVLRQYLPVLYVVGRKPERPRVDLPGAPPASLYTAVSSVEVGMDD